MQSELIASAKQLQKAHTYCWLFLPTNTVTDTSNPATASLLGPRETQSLPATQPQSKCLVFFFFFLFPRHENHYFDALTRLFQCLVKKKKNNNNSMNFLGA